MKVLIDYTGKRFGKLLVIARDSDYYVTPGGFKTVRWRCRCDCGNITIVLRSALQQGSTISCGCGKSTDCGNRFRIHGAYLTRTYRCWQSIHQRCSNPKTVRYPRYGGRGITVSPRWGVFPNFLVDMGECPKGMTIERKNNNGNYEPGNCRWATNREQARNKSTNRVLTVGSETMTLVEWSERSGVNQKVIHGRLRLGWSAPKAIFEPVQFRRKSVTCAGRSSGSRLPTSG